MRLEDYQKVVYTDLMGIYRRGQEDTIPKDHLFDSLNIQHGIRQWKTRDGLTPSIFPAFPFHIRRFAFFSGILLILDDQGNLYTYSQRVGDNASVANALINIGAEDFAAIQMLGKIFISFHDGQKGLTGINIKVLIPHPTNPALDEIRDAAGLAPLGLGGTPMVAADGAAGIVNAGVYKIAVAYITSTGFITQPGPKIAGVFTPTVYTSPGSVKIDLSNIPTGPGLVGLQRQILITKAGLEEYFFLGSAFGGILPADGVTSTAILDFNDTTDLVQSADFLFDLLETIPAAVTLQNYNGRLMTGGEADPNNSIIRGSNIGDVESFSAIDSFIPINKDDGFGVRNLLVIRGSLYVGKNLGAWYLRDNLDVLSSWGQAQPLDNNIAVNSHGIAEFYDSAGVRMARDWTLICDLSGILFFDGILRKPPITNKINEIWRSINFGVYHKISIVVDETHHKVYCNIPLNGSTECNTLLVGDYNICPGKLPESEKIKWGVYQFNPCNITIRPTEIGIFNYPPDTIPLLKIGSLDGQAKVYTLDPNTTLDDGADITSYWETGPQFWEDGFVHTFTAARLRLAGEGIIAGNIYGEDNLQSSVIPSINLGGTLDYRFFIEIPEGVIDGVNTIFKLCYHDPLVTFILVFQNGLLITTGYTINGGGDTITFGVAPLINDSIQVLYLIGTTTTQFQIEVPTGAIDGANVTFNLSLSPADLPYVLLYQNGLLLISSSYSIGGTGNKVITMVNAPQIGDTLVAIYHKDSIATGWVVEDKSSQANNLTTMFTLVTTPSREFVGIWQNGLLIRKFFDYFLSGNIVTIFDPPLLGDTLQFVYRRINSASGGITIGLEKLIRFNFQNEKAKLKFSMSAGRMIINKIEIFGQPTYPMRPM